MIELRNPIFKIKVHDTASFKQLQDKDLVGIDLHIQGEVIPIRKKQKCMVAYMDNHWRIEDYSFVDLLHVNLYSVSDIGIRDGTLAIKFSYQNGMILELDEEDIIALVPVRKKATRENGDIQQLMISISKVHR